MLRLPKILDIPKKLLPFVLQFNSFRFFLLHGGRGGGKTHAIARFLIYLAEKNKIRVLCGRETMRSIEKSVYTVFVDIIREFDLVEFTVMSSKIKHANGSEILFEGFREQGVVNTKGTEGIDILWIDEAEGLTKATLDVVIPTIRKENSKIIFSMNRKTRSDPAYQINHIRSDCLTIHVNYNENPFCSKELINEAMACKDRSEDDYNHIWLGQPKAQSENVLLSSKDLDNAKQVQFFGDTSVKGKVLSVDVAGGGGDLSVAGIIDYISPTRFNLSSVEAWDEKDLMKTTGRIMDLIYRHSPDVIVIDANAIGQGVYDRLTELTNIDIIDFKGSMRSEEVEAYNLRMSAFVKVRHLMQLGQIKVTDDRVLSDLEAMKYKFHGSGGKKIMLSKGEIKAEIQRSTDFADMFSMGVYGLDKIDFSCDNDNYQTSYL